MFTPGIGQLRVGWLLAALAVSLAACGSGGGGYGGKPTSAEASSSPAAAADSGGYGGYGARGGGSAAATAATVTVSKNGQLGSILVDGAGRSLYLFEKDKGSTSSCYSDCAAVWPPFTSNGPATAGPGVTGSLLGTASRTDGSVQVTYRGHPLYYYVSDAGKPASAAGEGLNQFGAAWYVLSPAGNKVDRAGS